MGRQATRQKRLDAQTRLLQHPDLPVPKKEPRVKAGKKRHGPNALVQASATNAEDILHEMLAAAAREGGRQWKKRRKVLERKESERRECALKQRTAGISMERKAAFAVVQGLTNASVEPFVRCFWRGESDGGLPSEELKLRRKALNIRVNSSATPCPPPLEAGVGDRLLPDSFKKYFKQSTLSEMTPVQRQVRFASSLSDGAQRSIYTQFLVRRGRPC